MTTTATPARADVFQQITDSIVATLETGARPWAKPWVDGAPGPGSAFPRNIKGRSYRGANVWWLMGAAERMGYTDPVWLTFNQAREAGGSVRKGEKGTLVFFWKFSKFEDKVTKELRDSVMVRTYVVFNVAQCDGLKLPAVPQPAERPLLERVQAAEDLLAATGARVSWGGNRAFYSPAFDSVQMPPRDNFNSADRLYGTLFHELGHWTGHDSRLKRDFKGRFGSEAYAFEELVAELTAAFVCGAEGFAAPEAREDHAAYLASWLKVLKGDKRAFITAASKAQAAADLILSFGASAEDELEPADVPDVAQAA